MLAAVLLISNDKRSGDAHELRGAGLLVNMCPLIYGPPIWLSQYSERFNYITLELHGDTIVLLCHLFVLWGHKDLSGLRFSLVRICFGLFLSFKGDEVEKWLIVAAAVEKVFLFLIFVFSRVLFWPLSTPRGRWIQHWFTSCVEGRQEANVSGLPPHFSALCRSLGLFFVCVCLFSVICMEQRAE